ncbi:50S ribosomal protein L13 [bacterium]|nr:50S ribosomal protein L13 [bacterium]MBT3903526.1 50S ribosomal protein L13 [bacterium]MBT4578023.1 50S ribosomal protein L13 [bacterium]MBT5346122.1 50S ribosomal protein L13 [bacterium]MBT6131391.1 50S ribosomal protein L13 [bacterium]
MNKTFFLKKGEHEPRWHIVDAKDQVLGRMAVRIANILRGKDRPNFTPHTDGGDYVVVINADKIHLTGNKWDGKIYVTVSGYLGGKKELTAKELLEKHPTQLVEKAVRGMLPKNRLNREVLKKLKVYAGDQHPHAAQLAGFSEDTPVVEAPKKKAVVAKEAKSVKPAESVKAQKVETDKA